jgi:hypothetical protein
MRRVTVPRERGQAAAISGLESDGKLGGSPSYCRVAAAPVVAAPGEEPHGVAGRRTCRR